MRKELSILYDETDDEALQQQIRLLNSSFLKPIYRPAIRAELTRLQKRCSHGVFLVRHLGRIYTLERALECEFSVPRWVG